MRRAKRRLPCTSVEIAETKAFVAWLHESGIGGRIDLPRLMILYGEYDELLRDDAAVQRGEPMTETSLTAALKTLRVGKGSRDLLTVAKRDDRSLLDREDKIALALWRQRAKSQPTNHSRPRVTWYDVGIPFTLAKTA